VQQRVNAVALSVLLALPAAIGAARAERQAVGRCADLAGLTLPDASLTAAEEVAAGSFTPPGTTRPLTVPAFCRVAATAKASP